MDADLSGLSREALEERCRQAENRSRQLEGANQNRMNVENQKVNKAMAAEIQRWVSDDIIKVLKFVTNDTWTNCPVLLETCFKRLSITDEGTKAAYAADCKSRIMFEIHQKRSSIKKAIRKAYFGTLACGQSRTVPQERPLFSCWFCALCTTAKCSLYCTVLLEHEDCYKDTPGRPLYKVLDLFLQGDYDKADEDVKDWWLTAMRYLLPTVSSAWRTTVGIMHPAKLSVTTTMSDLAFLLWHLKIFGKEWEKKYKAGKQGGNIPATAMEDSDEEVGTENKDKKKKGGHDSRTQLKAFVDLEAVVRKNRESEKFKAGWEDPVEELLKEEAEFKGSSESSDSTPSETATTSDESTTTAGNGRKNNKRKRGKEKVAVPTVELEALLKAAGPTLTGV